MRHLYFLLASYLLSSLCAQAQTPTLTAPEYIAAIKAAAPKGGVYIRAQMKVATADGQRQTLQVQIKRRELSPTHSEHLYQILSPKERRGEAMLLRVKGSSLSGSIYTPTAGLSQLKPNDRTQKVLGTDLTLEELLTDFMDWKHQTLVGKETHAKTTCVVLESTNGSDKVKSWVDEKRYVALKVEMYAADSSSPTRTILTTDTMRADSGYYVPTQFSIITHATGTVTEVEGSSGTRADVIYSDTDFTDEALKVISPAPRK
jgi:hypothetical protein